jgi:hypothetical protein
MDTVQGAGGAPKRVGDDGARTQLAAFSSRWRGNGAPVTVRCYAKQARLFVAGLPGPLDAALRRVASRYVLPLMSPTGTGARSRRSAASTPPVPHPTGATPQPQGSAADQQERHRGSRQHGRRQYSSRITASHAVRGVLRTVC